MKSVEELATEAFKANERLRCMGMTNMPTDYDERKQAAIEYAQAQAKAVAAQRALDEAIRNSK